MIFGGEELVDEVEGGDGGKDEKDGEHFGRCLVHGFLHCVYLLSHLLYYLGFTLQIAKPPPVLEFIEHYMLPLL